MLSYFRLQRCLFAVRHYCCANPSASFKDAHYCGLILGACSGDAALAFADVHVARLTADEGFIGFHFAREQSESAICQSKAQTVRHEPCSLLSHAEIAGQFARTDSV